MIVRALAALPLLLAAPTPGPVTDVVVEGTIVDLTLKVVALETETTEGTRTVITISSDVLFAFDKANLTKKAADHLAGIAVRLRTASGTVRVDGYTDAIGTDAYNLALSRRRAESVKRELDRTLRGRPVTAAAGHGEADPVAPNTKGGKDNPDGRAENRRVTIVFEGR